MPDGSFALVVEVEQSALVHRSPGRFKLTEPLRLTDVDGAEWMARLVDMIGESSVLEYERPGRE